MIKLFYILSLVLLGLSSCKVSQLTTEKEVVHQKHTYFDSTIVTTREVLDTAIMSASYASDSITLDLLKQLGRFNISNERAHTSVTYNPSTNKIFVDTKCDSAFQIYVKSLYESFSNRISQDLSLQIDQKLESKMVTKTPLKAYLTGFIIGVVTVAALVIIIYFYRKTK